MMGFVVQRLQHKQYALGGAENSNTDEVQDKKTVTFEKKLSELDLQISHLWQRNISPLFVSSKPSQISLTEF